MQNLTFPVRCCHVLPRTQRRRTLRYPCRFAARHEPARHCSNAQPQPLDDLCWKPCGWLSRYSCQSRARVTSGRRRSAMPHLRPVGQWSLLAGHRCRWKQMALQLCIGQRRGPGEATGSRKATEVITGAAVANAQAAGDLTDGQAAVKLEEQHLSDFTHG